MLVLFLRIVAVSKRVRRLAVSPALLMSTIMTHGAAMACESSSDCSIKLVGARQPFC